MTRTIWTPVMDLNLVMAVESSIAAGFHKTDGPKRSDQLRPYFWDAVAVMMADRIGGDAPHESPSAMACSKRFPVALETKRNMEELQSIGDEVLKSQLEKYDEEWSRWDDAELKAAEWERDIREATYDMVADIKNTVNALAKEWGLKDE